ALILERLDESLTRIGIHEIPAENRPFDSNTMNAVEVETRADVPEGTVSAVYRAGYTWRGETYRLAEVKVARRAATPASGETNT
ncbi:MAG: nucleotide exchange factor GrpE, partial [bacterium]|nr:nucleotide exchange factor GrpE [bacterium]